MGSLNRRRDSNFFHKYRVSSTDFEVVAIWNFISIGIALMVESDARVDVIQYSYDGQTVHGDMTPTMPSEGIVFDNRFQSKVWFRRATPGVPVVVRVEAWRNEA